MVCLSDSDDEDNEGISYHELFYTYLYIYVNLCLVPISRPKQSDEGNQSNLTTLTSKQSFKQRLQDKMKEFKQHQKVDSLYLCLPVS